ncbi:hypothetical protein [Bathymodiolus platifrons methanotrophic gill symbiont]|uniref:hypothetical protein n=1 Tax=Bathymodiolus platifrons methanotrophic gill symbiont TaxID=113268 RepID=UPI00142E08E2|nr:hypothetical protein [Bathymodiolus platifrons methanotrophic gill symbiont]
MLRSQHRVYDGVATWHVRRTSGQPKALAGRVKFLPLAWSGMPKTSFRKNSDSPA